MNAHLFSYTLLGQYWEMIEQLKITHLHTFPTVMKFLMKAGDEHVEKHNLSSRKVLALGTTVQQLYLSAEKERERE